MIRIADIVQPRVEKIDPRDRPELPFIGLDDIEPQTMRLLGTKQSSELKSSAKSFYPGDVLYARLRPYLNKVWLADRHGICSSEFIVLAGNDFTEPKFLALRLNAADFVAFANGFNTGDRPRVDFEQISSFFFPPFSLVYQHRIVAKIEALFSELDKGIEALKTAREQLKVYRQAVLKHAFEGKLTAQWREENKGAAQGSANVAGGQEPGATKLESPEQLLARIQQEREARYQQQLEEWKAAVKAWEKSGKEGKKPSKPKALSTPKSRIVHDFDVPDEWAILELEDLAFESVLGKMLDKQKNTGIERPYLGNINVRWGVFDLENLKTMKVEESEVERYSLQYGDLVVCEGGAPGRCAVWENADTTVIIQKALHRVRFTKSYNPKFGYYYLVYATPLERVVKNFTGTTIKHLTGAGLSKIQFPICSLDEQDHIINAPEAKFSETDALERDLENQLRKSETLRQSILKKAFSGQLVPQDPIDEPASVLLERIRAEKEAQSQSKAGKTAVRKKYA